MLGALVIVFREAIEAGLIVGIVLAATRGVPNRAAWVGLGIGVGAVGAGIIALFAEAISGAFEGAGQELLNASVLGAAVVMLMWHNAWMARHGRELAPQRVEGVAVEPACAAFQSLGLDQMRCADLGDVHLQLGMLAHEHAGGACMIEMNVCEQERRQVGEPDASLVE